MSLFPSSTSITDYAYPKTHPLRRGDFADPDADVDDPGEINRKAVALFDFDPENDNEVKLVEGQQIWISYRHGQGWLVAEDLQTGENGLVPEEYVEIDYDDPVEEARPFMKQFFAPADDWVDTDDELPVAQISSEMNNVSI